MGEGYSVRQQLSQLWLPFVSLAGRRASTSVYYLYGVVGVLVRSVYKLVHP